MSSPTDKPLARAQAHLAQARYAEAAGAFRAVLHIAPLEFQAHFGLADALIARGQRDEAIEGLIGAAEACGAQEDHAAALTLYGKALAVDPGRLELHLDVAIAEASLGREDAAQARLENLAEIYMQAGRTDEAAEVYRFLSSWDEEEQDDDEPEHEPPRAEAPAPVPTTAPHRAVPQHVPTTETVVVPTILVTPDGQLLQMPIDRQASEPVPVSKDPTVPPVPPELIEAAHSKPIDLAEGSQIQDVEGTVVAFPPPPPELPEEARAQPPDASREDLEAALAAAMENLALVEQLEEEDETLVMKAPLLPPRKNKAIAGPDGRLRIERAPRPKATAPAAAPAAKGPIARGSGTGPRPGPASRPGPGPRSGASAPGPGPGRPSPVRVAKAPRPTPTAKATPAAVPRGGPARRGPAPKAKPVGGPKPTRPNNPLVERLRRRAGLGDKEGGRPRSARSRETEPISVGRTTPPTGRSGSDPETK